MMLSDSIPEHRSTVVAFREVFHDAVELGHVYHVTKNDSKSQKKKISHDSWHCAQKTVAIAKEL